jgi:peroxiredoxin
MNIISAIIITTGLWRAVLSTPGGDLPFHLEINKTDSSYTLTVINGEERILLDDVYFKDDSLIATFPVYESELRLKMINSNELHGHFINLTRTTHASIPLKAYSGGAPRFFIQSKDPAKDVSGRWSVMFSPGTKDSSVAVGVFHQEGANVKGTFLTPSGDYRYLEGIMENDSLFLSTFNGVFVYLFKARVKKNTIEGVFSSGIHYQTNWTGFRNPSAKLPDATTVTTYRSPDGKFDFRFPDTDSNLVSLSDDRFRGKVIIIQILGSWCPNCLDESEYLTAYRDSNQHRGMEVIGLAFEKTDDFRRAAANVQRLSKRLNINYPILIASNRDKLRQVLPGLENFIAFPTTLYLDKSHKIRKIHAGFTGGAAGPELEAFKSDFEAFLEKLIEE